MIDNSGKLRWARNGQLVDTTAGRWKDAGHGKGIVSFSYPPTDLSSINQHSFGEPPRSSNMSSSLRSSSRSSTTLSTNEGAAEMHYMGVRSQSKNPVKRILLRNFTPRGLLERLLRKTIKRDTWIYVSVSNSQLLSASLGSLTDDTGQEV